ncbi:MAG: mechanosensitive ion channel family protein [Bacilli bacterium]|nr:mechanosensitive ion channel family protein [Bacilli bacterium]
MLEFILNKRFIGTIITIVALVFLYAILKNLIDRILNIRTKKANSDIRKINTLKSLFKNIVKYVLLFVGIVVILNLFGIDTMTLLAGLGVVGVVVGLALQDVLKDFFSGIFIIIENQFQVGDTIDVDGFKGEVVSLGLKSTRIKKYTGEIKIVSNRNIDSIINYSQANSLALIDVNVAYEEDIDKVQDILTKLCKKLSGEIENLQGEIQVLGVENLDSSSVVFRISVVAKPLSHFAIKREILKQVKLEFDKHKIKIPYPQVEVHNGAKI